MRDCLRLAGIIVGFLAATVVEARDVTVVGLFPGKVVVQIDGGPLRTLSPGQKTAEGVTVVSVDRESATFDVEGRRVTLGVSQARLGRSAPAAESATITADLQGHFSTDGQVNGRPLRFVIDTGATLVSIPAGEARRLGVPYTSGQKVLMRTANGTATGYLVKLDTVTVGSVTLHGVDAVVMEGVGLSFSLLGMSFLNRMDMRREGNIMTLTKRY
jgi:aspartyl protease family protein